MLYLLSYSQDFSNKGTDFWVGYGSHVSMYGSNGSVSSTGGGQDMVLYFTSDKNAVVTVSIPGVGWTKTYNVLANSVTESDAMPKTGSTDTRLATEGLSNNGIHITSDQPIVAYAHIYASSVSGASLLFPTNTLGQDYYALGFTQTSNSNYSYPFVFAIATEDSTVIEVTPSANTITHLANVPFTVTLNKGQVYNVLGQLTGGSGNNFTGVDLTGTRIRSVSVGGAGCKKIAMFCGTGKINIKCASGGNGASADNTIQQVFPSGAWGKKYITTPTSNMTNNFFRVMVSDPTTIVTLNGVALTGLTSNIYYQFENNTPNIISADKPIVVAQFISTANACGNNLIGGSGDPEMIYLSPVEQTINKITLNSTQHYKITEHHINVVLKTAGINSFKLDGNSAASSFVPLVADPSYAYAQFSVQQGFHSLQSDSGFNAIAYGYGSAESYGYNAGTNVIDLSQGILLQNQYATTNVQATCVGTPFSFAIKFPYQPTSITWDFGNNANLSPNAMVGPINNPVADSSFTVNGKTIYVYKLSGNYGFNTAGSYTVNVTANNPTPDGCSGLQQIGYTINVNNPPVANFGFITTGCVADSVKFSDSSNANAVSRTINKWNWSFGDNTIDSVQNPVKKYTTAANYNVKLRVISDIGCYSDTTLPVNISSNPIVKFGVSDTTCINGGINFRDSSTIAVGSFAKFYWSYGDGAKDTLTVSSTRTHAYTQTGQDTVLLTTVSNTGCTVSASKVIQINPRPQPGFIMPAICLSDAFAQFTDTSTIADNSQAQFKYLWHFGDPAANVNTNPDTSIVQNPKHKYTAAANYTVSEMVTSGAGCRATVTKTFTVNGATPLANFTLQNTGVLCSNLNVNIINTSTVDFGIVTKLEVYWDYMNDQTQKTSVDTPLNGAVFSHLYTNFQQPATESFRIRVFAYSGTSCVSFKDTNIVINASPHVSFSVMPGICYTAPARQITQAVETGNVPGAFTYSGTGVSGTGIFDPQIAGVSTDSIQALYTSTAGCRDSAKQAITVWPIPVAKWGASSPTCEKSDIIFTDSSVANIGNIVSWNWSFGDGTSQSKTTGNPFKKQYAAWGTDSVKLTVVTDSGCVSSVNKAVLNIHPLPNVNFSIPAQICLPDGKGLFSDSSTIADGSQALFSYLWNFNDPNSPQPSTLKNTTHRFAAVGSYAIQLRVTSKDGCVDSLTQTLSKIYPQPQASFTMNSTEICVGDAVNFTDASNGITSAVTQWNWDLAQGNLATTQNASRQFKDSGTFTIQLYIYNAQGCVSDTSIQSLTVDPYPHLSLTHNLVVLQYGSIQLKPDYYAIMPNFKWTPALYLSSDTATNPISSPLTDIGYKLELTGKGGCMVSDTTFITILLQPEIPNVFSPNGDGINDTWKIKYLESYPGAIIEVYNRNGQLIYHTQGYNGIGWDGKYNGQDLPIGTYYYIVDPKNGRPKMSGSVSIIR